MKTKLRGYLLMIDITTPVGRLVSGHPMVSHPVIDDKTKLPKLAHDGTPRIEFYVAIAIPKGAEQHWNQTEWGQQIYNEGVAGWPNGEHGAPNFAWKITDGDSQVPNKNGKKPCEREGWAGHWIIGAKNGFAINCYRLGAYNPVTDQLQTKEAIKCGDYIRLVLNVKGNAPSQSPGVYINPTMCELYQAGVAIVSENAPDPSATFGAVQGVLPQGAQVDANVPATQPGAMATPPANATVMAAGAVPQSVINNPGMGAPPAPGTAVAPAPDILTPPAPAQADYNININGQVYSHAALIAQGWTEEQLMGYPRA
jgi:hypothetical protein